MSYYENMVGRRLYMPEPSLEPLEEAPTCYCKRCGGEIYHSDPIFIEDGEPMHTDCLEEYFMELLKESPRQIAECLGMQYKEGA